MRGPTRFQITYALVEISFQNTTVFKTQILLKTQIQCSKHKLTLKYTKSVFKINRKYNQLKSV